MEILAHRGGAAESPENALSAFRHASQLGCRWVEFDVQTLRDGTPVVMHDPRAERTSTGTGRVCLYSREAFSRLRLRENPDERPPLLAETLDVLAELGLHFNLEVKCYRPADFQLIDDLTPGLAHHPCQWVISSFHRAWCLAYAQKRGGARLAILEESPSETCRTFAARCGTRRLHFDARLAQAGLIQDLALENYEVYLYGVEHPEQARAWAQRGVKGVFTDYPSRFQASERTTDI